jgi:hypothetical protein
MEFRSERRCAPTAGDHRERVREALARTALQLGCACAAQADANPHSRCRAGRPARRALCVSPSREKSPPAALARLEETHTHFSVGLSHLTIRAMEVEWALPSVV